jgi:hypothetical protein
MIVQVKRELMERPSPSFARPSPRFFCRRDLIGGGRTTTVAANAPFAMVAHVPRSIEASKLAIRVYLDNQLIIAQAANASGSGDLSGFSPEPLFQPGVWKYELTDVGGNVLGSGEIRAT